MTGYPPPPLFVPEKDHTIVHSFLGRNTMAVMNEVEKHSMAVARICGLFADIIGLPRKLKARLQTAGYLHDIGKYAIEEKVLMKPGPLTPDETTSIQKHSTLGVSKYINMCRSRGWQFEKQIMMTIFDHHERWDGFGYPFGKQGVRIEIMAQIVSVADVMSALCADRCYRDAFTFEAILEHLDQDAGRRWKQSYVDYVFDNQQLFRAVVTCDLFVEKDASKIRQSGHKLVGKVGNSPRTPCRQRLK